MLIVYSFDQLFKISFISDNESRSAGYLRSFILSPCISISFYDITLSTCVRKCLWLTTTTSHTVSTISFLMYLFSTYTKNNSTIHVCRNFYYLRLQVRCSWNWTFCVEKTILEVENYRICLCRRVIVS